MTTLEELENQLKVKRAERRLEELETAFETIKKEVHGAENFQDLVKVMSRYVAKVGNARSVINKSQE